MLFDDIFSSLYETEETVRETYGNTKDAPEEFKKGVFKNVFRDIYNIPEVAHISTQNDDYLKDGVEGGTNVEGYQYEQDEKLELPKTAIFKAPTKEEAFSKMFKPANNLLKKIDEIGNRAIDGVVEQFTPSEETKEIGKFALQGAGNVISKVINNTARTATNLGNILMNVSGVDEVYDLIVGQKNAWENNVKEMLQLHEDADKAIDYNTPLYKENIPEIADDAIRTVAEMGLVFNRAVKVVNGGVGAVGTLLATMNASEPISRAGLTKDIEKKKEYYMQGLIGGAMGYGLAYAPPLLQKQFKKIFGKNAPETLIKKTLYNSIERSIGTTAFLGVAETGEALNSLVTGEDYEVMKPSRLFHNLVMDFSLKIPHLLSKNKNVSTKERKELTELNDNIKSWWTKTKDFSKKVVEINKELGEGGHIGEKEQRTGDIPKNKMVGAVKDLFDIRSKKDRMNEHLERKVEEQIPYGGLSERQIEATNNEIDNLINREVFQPKELFETIKRSSNPLETTKLVVEKIMENERTNKYLSKDSKKFLYELVEGENSILQARSKGGKELESAKLMDEAIRESPVGKVEKIIRDVEKEIGNVIDPSTHKYKVQVEKFKKIIEKNKKEIEQIKEDIINKEDSKPSDIEKKYNKDIKELEKKIEEFDKSEGLGAGLGEELGKGKGEGLGEGLGGSDKVQGKVYNDKNTTTKKTKEYDAEKHSAKLTEQIDKLLEKQKAGKIKQEEKILLNELKEIVKQNIKNEKAKVVHYKKLFNQTEKLKAQQEINRLKQEKKIKIKEANEILAKKNKEIADRIYKFGKELQKGLPKRLGQTIDKYIAHSLLWHPATIINNVINNATMTFGDAMRSKVGSVADMWMGRNTGERYMDFDVTNPKRVKEIFKISLRKMKEYNEYIDKGGKHPVLQEVFDVLGEKGVARIKRITGKDSKDIMGIDKYNLIKEVGHKTFMDKQLSKALASPDAFFFEFNALMELDMAKRIANKEIKAGKRKQQEPKNDTWFAKEYKNLTESEIINAYLLGKETTFQHSNNFSKALLGVKKLGRELSSTVNIADLLLNTRFAQTTGGIIDINFQGTPASLLISAGQIWKLNSDVKKYNKVMETYKTLGALEAQVHRDIRKNNKDTEAVKDYEKIYSHIENMDLLKQPKLARKFGRGVFGTGKTLLLMALGNAGITAISGDGSYTGRESENEKGRNIPANAFKVLGEWIGGGSSEWSNHAIKLGNKLLKQMNDLSVYNKESGEREYNWFDPLNNLKLFGSAIQGEVVNLTKDMSANAFRNYQQLQLGTGTASMISNNTLGLGIPRLVTDTATKIGELFKENNISLSKLFPIGTDTVGNTKQFYVPNHPDKTLMNRTIGKTPAKSMLDDAYNQKGQSIPDKPYWYSNQYIRDTDDSQLYEVTDKMVANAGAINDVIRQEAETYVKEYPELNLSTEDGINKNNFYLRTFNDRDFVPEGNKLGLIATLPKEVMPIVQEIYYKEMITIAKEEGIYDLKNINRNDMDKILKYLDRKKRNENSLIKEIREAWMKPNQTKEEFIQIIIDIAKDSGVMD